MRLITIVGLLGFAASTQTVRGDGLIYQLPPDGSSVRYDIELIITSNGQENTLKGSLTISSVGATTVDGAKCRWIEFKHMYTTNDGLDRITIAKCLVPEEHLGRGKSPGEHMVRGWIKRVDGQVHDIKDLGIQPGRVMLDGYLAGSAQNEMELDAVEVDGKLGKLMCPAVSGEKEFRRDYGALRLTFENRLNEKSPFGVVNAVWKMDRLVNGQVTASETNKLTLAETYTTALSELPERN